VWQWLPRPRKGVLALVVCALVSYVVSATGCAFVLTLPLPAHVWTSLPLYAFLIVFYMHLYFAVDRSLSVRTLGELAKSRDGFATYGELDILYPRQDMIERRVEVLRSKGLLTLTDGNAYACTARSRFLVRLALVGKRLYNLHTTG
jgi:hypothetical protein